MADTQPAPAKPDNHNGTIAMALDFGPLLVFFIAFKFLGVFAGTAVFMVAIAIACAVSWVVLKRVSPMLWLSAIMVIFFGGLTIYFHDQSFIQKKPTYIYTFFSVLLFGGWVMGKPLLRYLLQAAYDGLSEAGWLALSRNWAIFFALMAALNEVLRNLFTFDTWLTFKVWGVTALSFAFALINLPMLMRHGLTLENKGAVEDAGETSPPQG